MLKCIFYNHKFIDISKISLQRKTTYYNLFINISYNFVDLKVIQCGNILFFLWFNFLFHEVFLWGFIHSNT